MRLYFRWNDNFLISSNLTVFGSHGESEVTSSWTVLLNSTAFLLTEGIIKTTMGFTISPMMIIPLAHALSPCSPFTP